MSQQRSSWVKWVASGIVIAIAIGGLGFTALAWLGAIVPINQASGGVAPSPTATLSTQKLEELEAQAKGYELVVQREPQNEVALRGLLETRLRLGDIQGSISPLEQLTKLKPEQTDYAILLAQAKQHISDKEGAAQTYRSILTSNPGNLDALQGLVSLLIQEKRPEAAIGLLQDTLKTATPINDIKPGTVDITSVQLLLGQVYAIQKRYTQAIAIYDEAIKTNSQDFRPVLAKALILSEQGKVTDAKPLFTTAVSLAPAKYKDQVQQLANEVSQPKDSSSAKQPPTSSPAQPNNSSPAPESPASSPTAAPENAPASPEPSATSS